MIEYLYHRRSGEYQLAAPKNEAWRDDCEILTPQQYVAHVHPDLYGYDIECYPNVFTFSIKHIATGQRWNFEISFRRNDGVQLFLFLTRLRENNARMVGFNNVGYDYPVVHELVQASGQIGYAALFSKSAAIIATPWDDRFKHRVWVDQVYVTQIDLLLIHHFDNSARSTALKMLEFNMRANSIQDLPYPPGVPLLPPQLDPLIAYNDHDVDQTIDFLYESLDLLEFRDELTERDGRDCTNFNDIKIGEQYFVAKLERMGIPCYEDRKPRQTVRQTIALVDVVLPWLEYREPEFQRVLNWFKDQTITQLKGTFKDVDCTVNGFKYVFGLGGIHGSITSSIVTSDDEYEIVDIDVKSYYPNLAIANGFFPAHLGVEFCQIYKTLYEERQSHTKGTAANGMLKLALNGVYGGSNSKYSPFFDTQYTASITINGQLLLCLLSEQLAAIAGLQMIQINTDGMTVRIPRNQSDALNDICYYWELRTGLELERNDYRRMWVRDVNSYIAEKTDGKLKRIGAYAYGAGTHIKGADGLTWEKNFSAQVVARAAEAAMVYGKDHRQFIYNHADIFDFMLRTKVNRTDKLMLNVGGVDVQQLQRITRYYVSHGGGSLVKIMPPLAKKVAAGDSTPRRISIGAGWQIHPCNEMADYTGGILNYEYYIQEAEKLIL